MADDTQTVSAEFIEITKADTSYTIDLDHAVQRTREGLSDFGNRPWRTDLVRRFAALYLLFSTAVHRSRRRRDRVAALRALLLVST